MLQKRMYRRFGLDGNVACKTSDDRRRIVRAYLDDISLGGLRLSSQERIPVDKLIHFTIASPLSKTAIQGKGRIRHVSVIQYGQGGFLHGIKFERIKTHKVKELINKTREFEPRKKPFLSLQHKNELSFMIRALPFVFLLCWAVNAMMSSMNTSLINDRAYEEKIRDGLLYFLYHAS